MEFENMIQLLDMAWYLRSEIVPCLVGPPGIGKTAAVRQHAKAHNCGKVVKIVASRCIPSETVGMTMPDHKHRSMSIYNSMQLSSLEDGDILFLDELLEADQYVLSTLLTVIESREMADGTPLPDIQIIAATNDTVSPEQLKGNIRQRFMFERFSIDNEQTSDYIEELTGMVIPSAILSKMSEDGSDYNFLTPRSLTKLCLWVNSVPEEKLGTVAGIINRMWNNTLGSELVAARRERDYSPRKQLQVAVLKSIKDNSAIPGVPGDFDFDNCTINELYEMLQNLPEWENIKRDLSVIEVREREEDKEHIQF